MILKILKILTILSFLLITLDSGHIGGQFGLFIVLGFLSGFKGLIISIFITILMVFLIISVIKPLEPKLDFYLYFLSGVLSLIPIIMHLSFLFSKNRSDKFFYFTIIIYFIFYTITVFKILKQGNITDK